MKLWLNRDLCQGSELCTEFAGQLLTTDEEYIVRFTSDTPDGFNANSAIIVPESMHQGILAASKACPSSAICLIDTEEL